MSVAVTCQAADSLPPIPTNRGLAGNKWQTQLLYTDWSFSEGAYLQMLSEIKEISKEAAALQE